MKKLTPFLKHVLFLVFSLHFFGAEANFFAQVNFENAKSQAQKEHKLLMLKFGASWCLPCRYMDQNVFTDEKLNAYLTQNVVGLQVDVDQSEGAVLKSKYKIGSVPTIVFIRPDGQEISRKENSMGISEFQQWVEHLVNSNPIATNNSPTLMVSYSSQSRQEVKSKSELQISSKNNLNKSSTSKITNQTLTTDSSKVKDYQDQNIALFGQFYVQLGAYALLDNAVTKAQELDDQFSQNANIMEVEDTKGKTIYKLNLGPFDSEEEAELFVEVLKDRKLEALVKKAEF